MTHLIIAGYGGTGHGAVGRLLADRLRLPLIDGDAEIAQTASTFSIAPESPVLRAAEAQVLASLRQRDSAVVILDGNVLSIPENRALARRTGPIIGLQADPAVIGRRAAAQRPRVKVAEPLAKIRELLETRHSSFPSADIRVDTTTLEPVAVAEQVLERLNRVRVNLSERSYDIHLQPGCHAWVGQLIAQLPEQVSSVVVISNRDIDRGYGSAIRASLDAAELKYFTLLVPTGERYKTLNTANRLYGDLIQRKVDRKSVILALGGGVIGDLAGFVAGTYERGIRFVQVPTSLLAQVDSSVGGKVGVNHPLGKNMIGVFLQPQVVLIDPGTLATLPLRELRSGLAEVIKYGVIWDDDFFAYLEDHVDAILRLDAQAIMHVIRRSCQVKAHVVEEDERESGLRAILNFGHTAAHAVETFTGYERYTHGEAVAVGMVVAARIAHGVGMLPAEPVHRLMRLLERFGLPIHLPKADPAILMSLMETDKKAVAGNVRFVLPTKIGSVETVGAIPRDILRRAITESIEL